MPIFAILALISFIISEWQTDVKGVDMVILGLIFLSAQLIFSTVPIRIQRGRDH